MIECFQKRDNDIADDHEGDENIECTADPVALVADLDDVKYLFFHSGYFYNSFLVNVFPCWYKEDIIVADTIIVSFSGIPCNLSGVWV